MMGQVVGEPRIERSEQSEVERLKERGRRRGKERRTEIAGDRSRGARDRKRVKLERQR